MTDVESLVAELHKLPTFLPWDFIRDCVLPTIASTVILLTSFYGTVLVLLVAYGGDKRSFFQNDSAKITKAAYQLTNLVMNSILGGLGLYYHYWELPSSTVGIQHRITGFETELYLLACIQIGYQLWSLAVGTLVVRESTAMLAHHVSVLIVACMSAFLTNGFRYHTPFFYGMLELSSIPLAVMNFFKDHARLVEQYPLAFLIVRLLFMILFLTIRIVMLLPKKYDYLWLCYWVLKTSDSLPFRAFMAFCWTSAFFLALLQLFWASLILKGFVKLLQGNKNNAKQKKE